MTEFFKALVELTMVWKWLRGGVSLLQSKVFYFWGTKVYIVVPSEIQWPPVDHIQNRMTPNHEFWKQGDPRTPKKLTCSWVWFRHGPVLFAVVKALMLQPWKFDSIVVNHCLFTATAKRVTRKRPWFTSKIFLDVNKSFQPRRNGANQRASFIKLHI